MKWYLIKILKKTNGCCVEFVFFSLFFHTISKRMAPLKIGLLTKVFGSKLVYKLNGRFISGF